MILRMLVRSPLLLVGSLMMAIAPSPQFAFSPLILMSYVSQFKGQAQQAL